MKRFSELVYPVVIRIPPAMKVCSKCGVPKLRSAFTSREISSDRGATGLDSCCKECNNQQARLYYAMNPEKFAFRNKKSYLRNKAKRQEYNRKNISRFREIRRGYIRGYMQKRRAIDLSFSILMGFRNRIRGALVFNRKSARTVELIGGSIEQARKHLESLFKPGMSWENRGRFGWHIDHIKPCAKFDLSDPEQQKQCFHYTNLQPLWWWENLAKGAK